MDISAQLVMQLRDKTGVSMMACKKALLESNGDMEKAIEVLRKSGEAKAAAKAERTTNEGRLFFKIDGTRVAIVKLLCETDFVARNDDFIQTGNSILDIALQHGAEKAMAEGDPLLKNAILKLGENMSINTVKVLEGKVWGAYIHSTNKVGAVVSIENGTEELAKDIAMHVTAMSPRYLSPDDVKQEEVDKEIEIMKAQLQKEGKPEAIWDKILAGKVKKYREENALLTQPFVKDPSLTVEKTLHGAKITVFERISI
jgi:elongation factor Ts